MNEKVLRRSDFVKYLGVYIDEKLTWSVHINKLSLQLAKYNAMLYQIRDYVTEHTLNMLFCIQYSKLWYHCLGHSSSKPIARNKRENEQHCAHYNSEQKVFSCYSFV